MTDYDGARTESATDELRRMLDERGAEYYTSPNGVAWGKLATPIHRRMYTHYAVELDGLLCVESHCITPEQAIAATLGAGTCHDEGDPNDFCCSECGVRMFTESNDTYTMIAADGRTIIKHPNFCPNCGAKIVGPTTNDVDGEVVA